MFICIFLDCFILLGWLTVENHLVFLLVNLFLRFHRCPNLIANSLGLFRDAYADVALKVLLQ